MDGGRCNAKSKARADGEKFMDYTGSVFYEKVAPSDCPTTGDLSLYQLKYENSYCKQDAAGGSWEHRIGGEKEVKDALDCSR